MVLLKLQHRPRIGYLFVVQVHLKPLQRHLHTAFKFFSYRCDAIYIKCITIQIDVAHIAVEFGYIAVAGQCPGGIAVQIDNDGGYIVHKNGACDILILQVQRHITAIFPGIAPGISGCVQEDVTV